MLLLPLLLRLLSKHDLGMYFVFLSLNGIIVVLDLGFSPTLGRFVGYAMGGAKRLVAFGMVEEEVHGSPNYPLLWELLVTGRVFYRFVALAAALLLTTAGSLMVMQKVGETSSPHLTWLGWGVSVAAVAAEAYFNVWNIFLRSINQVLVATRISMLAYSLRLVLACLFLLAGGGLLSLPAASLVTSLIIRNFSRYYCLKALAAYPKSRTEVPVDDNPTVLSRESPYLSAPRFPPLTAPARPATPPQTSSASLPFGAATVASGGLKRYASMNRSRSPSSTALTLPVSSPVRWSLTS